MSKLLIQESPLTFQPSLAVAIGINEAIVLQQVHYWISNPRNKGYEQEGFKWVYNTYSEWKETNFPFWSENTIQRTFSNLEDAGLIVSIQPMKSKYDRTKYYRIDYTKLDVFDDPKLVRSLNESETNTETNTETASIFKLYESEIGVLTPMVADELKQAEKDYPFEWISEALSEAVKNNKRNWKYAAAILKRWKAQGHKNDNDTRKTEPQVNAPRIGV